MKIRHILSALLVFAAAACQQAEIGTLSEIKVSESSLSIPVDGGNTLLFLDASRDWEIDPASVPEWLKADPMTGHAGEVTVTFSAPATNKTNKAEVKILCGGQTQYVNVIQYAQKADPVILTVADALKLIKAVDPGDGQNHDVDGEYYVKGVVSKIVEISASYGNATFYLSDDGKHDESKCLQVYRGYWLDGEKFTKGNEFSVGDEITIVGALMSYKGTPETAQGKAYVYAFEPSKISVEEFTFEKLPAADTTFRLVVTAKESPLLITSDSDWLQIVEVNKDGSYKLHADENIRSAERVANVSISGPTARKSVAITQKGAPATGASVTEIIAMDDNSQVQTLPSTIVVALTSAGAVLSDGSKAIYAYGEKAAALKIGDAVQVSAKKTTYNGVPELTDISDVFTDKEGVEFDYPSATDITPVAVDYAASEAEFVKLTGTLKVSGKYYNLELDGTEARQGSIVSPLADMNVAALDGKKITVTGYFNGISGGKYVNVIAVKIAEYVDNPKGTETNPYGISEIATLLKDGTTFSEPVFLKGIVSQKTTYNFGGEKKYNTASFWLSDDGVAHGVSTDGKTTTEPTQDFECYSVYYLGGDLANPTPGEGVNGNIEVGDEVVIYGNVTWYAKSSIAETVNKKAKIHSINKTTTDVNGLGNVSFPFSTAGAFAFIEAELAEKTAATEAGVAAPAPKNVYVKGKVSKVVNSFTSNAGTDKYDGMGTFWTSDDGTYGDNKGADFEAYQVFYFGGAKWTSAWSDVAVGDDVVLFGELTKYVSKSGAVTYETNAKKAYIYSHNGKTE